MAISKSERLRKIYENAISSFNDIQSAQYEVRMECLQDRRFCSIPGAQWEGLEDQFQNRPLFEVNEVNQGVVRIDSEYRKNRITVDYVSSDGAENDNLADICDGLYRAAEQASNADEAYDNAFWEAVTGGIGAWRYKTEYVNPDDKDDDRQRLVIEPIFDADKNVFFDLNAKRQDKADAVECFVLTSVHREEFLDKTGIDSTKWPKKNKQIQKAAQAGSFPNSISQSEFDWTAGDCIYVAEYYRVEEVTETIRVFRGVDGEEVKHSQKDFENNPELEATLEATGYEEIRQRKIKSRKIHKYLLSGGGYIEDEGYIAGKYIPIVIVFGKRSYIDNIERAMGHVRLVKDAQRIKNMQMSKLAEISALSSVEKPIFTPEQINGFRDMWKNDNIRPSAYLLVNPIMDANGQKVATGPIGYTRVPQIPPALGALLAMTKQDIQDLMGNQQQADKMVSNIAEKTVERIQNSVDMQSFIFMSNFARGMGQGGRIALSIFQDILIEEGRKTKVISRENKVSQVELMRPTMTKEGEMVIENDLSKANFDVVVDIGPSSTSRRASVIRQLTTLMSMTQDPQQQDRLMSMAITNMEGEGLQDFRDFYRQQLVRQGVLKPTDDEKKQMEMEAQQRGPDPQQRYLEAAANEADAKASQARVDAVKTLAQAELTRAQVAKTEAETVETLASITQSQREFAFNAAEKLKNSQQGGMTPQGTPSP